MASFEERVRGVVYGAAFGDALGAPVEKLTEREIAQKYGRVDSLRTEWHRAGSDVAARGGRIRGNGIYTDDTLMTGALIATYSKLRRHIDAFDFAREFMQEIAFRPRYIPELAREAPLIERLFYPEKYPFVRLTLANCDPRSAGVGNMVNCGAAMYIAPVGVVNACDPEAAYHEAIGFALAHQTSYGLEAAGVMAACVAAAFRPGVRASDIVDTALSVAKDGTRAAIDAVVRAAREAKAANEAPARTAQRLHEALLPYCPVGDDVNRSIERVGSPSANNTPSRLFSIEELPVALGYIELHDGEVYPAVIDGVNSGRDTDSIGTMIGAILGAMHGESAFRDADIALIEEANHVDLAGVAGSLTAAAAEVIGSDLRRADARAGMLKSIMK